MIVIKRSPTLEHDDATETTFYADDSQGSRSSGYSNSTLSTRREANNNDIEPRKRALNGSCLIHRTQENSMRTPFTRKPRSRKRVEWDQLEIHTFSMMLGDNPSVTSGCPVTIGWEAESHESTRIDDYEALKQEAARTQDEMRLPRMLRDDICRMAGFARSEMKKTRTLVQNIQENRTKSARDGLWAQRLRGFLNRQKSSGFANVCKVAQDPPPLPPNISSK